MRIPTVIRDYSNTLLKRNSSKFKESSRFQTTCYKDSTDSKENYDVIDPYRTCQVSPKKDVRFSDEIESQI